MSLERCLWYFSAINYTRSYGIANNFRISRGVLHGRNFLVVFFSFSKLAVIFLKNGFKDAFAVSSQRFTATTTTKKPLFDQPAHTFIWQACVQKFFFFFFLMKNIMIYVAKMCAVLSSWYWILTIFFFCNRRVLSLKESTLKRIRIFLSFRLTCNLPFWTIFERKHTAWNP